MALIPACARHSSSVISHDRAYIAPVVVTPPKPLKPLIMIDPGHGGKDLGAVSLSKPTYQEKNLNLSTARFLEQYLKHRGYPVVMTRHDDSFPSLLMTCRDGQREESQTLCQHPLQLRA